MKTALLAAALIANAAAAATDPNVIWTGDFEAGASSLKGNCSAGQNQWCADQTIRAAQIQTEQDTLIQGKYGARFEVKYGDVYNGYSDSRSLMTGPITLWEDEGNERWYRWQVQFPTSWVGKYPKWDQLSDYPSAYSNGASFAEWHHDANGAVETGSAPLYIRADDKNISVCLVDQATSECRETIILAPIIRGQWQDIVVHAKWSSNPAIGFLDIYVDGVHVLPMHYGSNKYPGMRNYLIVGLYRNGEIGDPNLLYSNGTHVYGTDGAVQSIYMDGFIVGSTQASVLGETLLTDSGSADAGTPDAGSADAGSTADAGSGVADAGTSSGGGSADAGSSAGAGGSSSPADAGTAAGGGSGSGEADAGSATGTGGSGTGGSGSASADAGTQTNSTADAGGDTPTGSSSTSAVTTSSLGGGGGCATGGSDAGVWLLLAGGLTLFWRLRRRVEA